MVAHNRVFQLLNQNQDETTPMTVNRYIYREREREKVMGVYILIGGNKYICYWRVKSNFSTVRMIIYSFIRAHRTQ